MKKMAILLFCVSLFSFQVQSVQAQATNLYEDFSTCVSGLPAGWQSYSVSGTQQWQCTTSGYIGSGVRMNGYSGGANTNDDWLISPLLDLSAYQSPQLAFWNYTAFNGSPLQVLVSNNYSGSGNPNAATWIPVPVGLALPNSSSWFYTNFVNLNAYKSQPLHIAFKYLSTNSAAADWRIDDVTVTDGSLFVYKQFVHAGDGLAGGYSGASSFTFMYQNLTGGPLTVTAPSPFQLSKDGITYASQLTYTSGISGLMQNVFVRTAPTVADKVYRKEISFALGSVPLGEKVYVLGTSLPDQQTLQVANWNMRWFGDPSFCGCDTNLARLNATQVLKDMQADVYCLQEVVNINQLAQITSSLGSNYQYAVAPFGSGATSTSSFNYPGCQKLAYIYNTSKIQNLGTFGLLASTYPADTSAYYCFSSGRYPFIMKAKLLLNGNSDTVIIANIHSKAGSTTADYQRRQCGVQHMTDSLNALFPGKKVLVIGDYNDYLEGTPVSGQTVTPYQYLLSNNYQGITLPSHYPGQSTYTGTTDHMIDNVVCSNALFPSYADSSCFIFTEPEKYLTDFANTTSDHYPMMSYFHFNFPAPTSVDESVTQSRIGLINPSSDLILFTSSGSVDQEVAVTVYDMTGQRIQNVKLGSLNGLTRIPVSGLSAGLYLVDILHQKQHIRLKWIKP
ncbi:MAG: choice-of-anchor J domain-containing protein [Chitinophagaceae bacterium]|nr:choice-of-anchor J domain-containing protein [Chitinophagaceae bacterium]